jgi:hypothetical protein
MKRRSSVSRILAKIASSFILWIVLALLAVISWFMFYQSDREGVDDDSAGTTKQIGYLICDNQMCNDTNGTDLTNFRVVSGSFTMNQWKSLIFSQNGPYITGSNTPGSGERKSGQSYKVLGMNNYFTKDPANELKFIEDTDANIKTNTIDFSVTLIDDTDGKKKVDLTDDLNRKIENYWKCRPYQKVFQNYKDYNTECSETTDPARGFIGNTFTGNSTFENSFTGDPDLYLCHSKGYLKKKYDIVPDEIYYTPCEFRDSKNKLRNGYKRKTFEDAEEDVVE